MRAPAGIYEFGAQDFRFDLERGDVDLFPAPDMHERRVRARKPMKLPELGHAVTAWKGWWEQEFLFRGFGIGFVKPLFRGLFLRPDFGLGVRLPLTLHFRSWESREALPSVALSFFVLWPPAVQVSQAMSYPAESLQEWVTTTARKIAVPSKEKLQVRGEQLVLSRLFDSGLTEVKSRLETLATFSPPSLSWNVRNLNHRCDVGRNLSRGWGSASGFATPQLMEDNTGWLPISFSFRECEFCGLCINQ